MGEGAVEGAFGAEGAMTTEEKFVEKTITNSKSKKGKRTKMSTDTSKAKGDFKPWQKAKKSKKAEGGYWMGECVLQIYEDEEELVGGVGGGGGSIQKKNERSQDELERILQLAKETDHPRAYEVAGQLLKTNAENTEKLVNLQTTKKKVTEVSGPKNVTNALFVGQTAELQKLIKGKNV